MGTSNPDGWGFLSDTTGSRRFLSVTLDKIDWRYSSEIDPAQLWAQMYAAYQRGETPRLETVELERRDMVNRAYETEGLEGWILRIFDVGPEVDGTTPTWTSGRI